MAQRALPPGAIRRRAVFGLLDADGWTWAGLRAGFWFLFIIFMLGYIPNLAYYFTVQNTVEVGYNFASIVNWCPESNEDLPCPAPVGATLPWQTSPTELAMPDGARGLGHLPVGHASVPDRWPDQRRAHDRGPRHARRRSTGTSRPGPTARLCRSPVADAAVGVYLGVPFVMGGLDASGKPTDTVYKGIVEDGQLTGWELANGENGTDPLTMPVALSQASVIAGTSGFVLLGGLDASGAPVTDVHVAWVGDGLRRLTPSGVGATRHRPAARTPRRRRRELRRRLRLCHRRHWGRWRRDRYGVPPRIRWARARHRRHRPGRGLGDLTRWLPAARLRARMRRPSRPPARST